MEKIENSMILLATLEHSNKEDKVLHQNSHENGLTYWGIYESMNPSWKYYIKVNKVSKVSRNVLSYISLTLVSVFISLILSLGILRLYVSKVSI